MRAIVVLLCLARVATATPNPRLAAGLDEHVGDTVPRQLVFTDSTGHSVPLARFFDGKRPVVLVIAYARCSMLCSVVLRGLVEAVRTSTLEPGRDYLPVVVSLDSRETPDEAARRQNRLLDDAGYPRQRDAWPYLVGNEASIATLARSLGFRYAWDPQTEQYAHPAVVFVLTPEGRIAEYLHGVTYELTPAVTRAAHGELTTAIARDLLSCFRFDPSLRRYEANIALLYRLGAALVLIALAALITALVIWERRRGAS